MAKIEKVSPLAPAKFPNIPEIDGVEFSTAAAGIKYQDRTDLMLAILDPGTEIAVVFTSFKQLFSTFVNKFIPIFPILVVILK